MSWKGGKNWKNIDKSILLRVTTESWKNTDPKEVTNGKFVYVAIDSNGMPREIATITKLNKLKHYNTYQILLGA